MIFSQRSGETQHAAQRRQSLRVEKRRGHAVAAIMSPRSTASARFFRSSSRPARHRLEDRACFDRLQAQRAAAVPHFCELLRHAILEAQISSSPAVSCTRCGAGLLPSSHAATLR